MIIQIGFRLRLQAGLTRDKRKSMLGLNIIRGHVICNNKVCYCNVNSVSYRAEYLQLLSDILPTRVL